MTRSPCCPNYAISINKHVEKFIIGDMLNDDVNIDAPVHHGPDKK